tara:strand:- start:312 stop:416 length:105 start_codon:yes stop_codon:yes gene_type:complete
MEKTVQREWAVDGEAGTVGVSIQVEDEARAAGKI